MSESTSTSLDIPTQQRQLRENNPPPPLRKQHQQQSPLPFPYHSVWGTFGHITPPPPGLISRIPASPTEDLSLFPLIFSVLSERVAEPQPQLLLSLITFKMSSLPAPKYGHSNKVRSFHHRFPLRNYLLALETDKCWGGVGVGEVLVLVGVGVGGVGVSVVLPKSPGLLTSKPISTSIYSHAGDLWNFKNEIFSTYQREASVVAGRIVGW